MRSYPDYPKKLPQKNTSATRTFVLCFQFFAAACQFLYEFFYKILSQSI
jgi:hypothetical protein